MIINHNIPAMNTLSQLSSNNSKVQDSLEKLSSGMQINKAADDAAGLAISEKMRSQIRGLDQAKQNAQDGISLIQTAEGALNESHSILQRMSELATQSANDTNTKSDRQQLQKEVDQLSKELTRISEDTTFNKQQLLNGGFDSTFQIGANEGQSISIEIGNSGASDLKVGHEISKEDVDLSSGAAMNAGEDYSVVSFDAQDISDGASSDPTNINAEYGLKNSDGEIIAVSADGKKYSDLASPKAQNELSSAELASSGNSVDFGSGNEVTSGTVSVSDTDNSKVDITATGGINISSQEKADQAIATINDAIESVSSQRSELGAYQNRLEHTINNLSTSSENLTSAESRIRDVDMAKEMMSFTKNNILTQASQSMLAQANQLPQGVLQLLQ